MASSIHERFDSRSHSGNTTTYKYVVVGTDDLDEVRNLVETESPEALSDGSPRGDISADPQGGQMWLAEVAYSPRERQTSSDAGADPGPQPGADGTVGEGNGNVAPGANANDPLDTGISFSTGGGTVRLFTSIATVASHAPVGRTAPDHKRSINVQPDGTIEGVEVLAPKGSFVMTRRVPRLTAGYFFNAMSSTATINADPWKGFWSREVLFEGIEGSYKGGGDGKWDLTYHFGYSPNRPVALDGWTPFMKRGWDYIWFEYETIEDTTASPKKTTRRPFAAHVEQVYHTKDFNEFQL